MDLFIPFGREVKRIQEVINNTFMDGFRFNK